MNLRADPTTMALRDGLAVYMADVVDLDTGRTVGRVVRDPRATLRTAWEGYVFGGGVAGKRLVARAQTRKLVMAAITKALTTGEAA